MKKYCVLVLATLGLMIGCKTEEVYLTSLSSGQRRAAEAAVRHAGFESVDDVHMKKCEYNFGLRKRYYEVKFKSFWFEYEYEVNASNGEILKTKREFDW